jgi:hypothetical protein
MRKQRIPKTAVDCVSLQDKIAYRQMLRAKWEAIPFDAPPSAISDLLDKYPYDPAYPHSHPEWAAGVLRSEAEKRRQLKRRGRDDE